MCNTILILFRKAHRYGCGKGVGKTEVFPWRKKVVKTAGF